MSDFTGTRQREVGNRGELEGGGGVERVCHRLLSLDRQQKKACAIIIHLSLFSSHGPIFFSSYLPEQEQHRPHKRLPTVTR